MNKISVAMTTFNGEKFLSQQLESIAVQSRRIDEFIVCDDGSADNTVAILYAFAKEAPFNVKIFENKDNLGSTKNFEKAMSFCTGDIIVLCDQDDVWVSRKIEVFENAFLENPGCGMIFTDAEVIDEENNFLYYLWQSVGFNARRQKLLNGNEKGIKLLLKNNMVTGATAAVTKKFFEEALPFPQAAIHDYWLAIIAAIKNILVFLPDITIKYRKHTAQQIGCDRKSFNQKMLFEANYGEAVKQYQALHEGLKAKKLLDIQYNKILTDKIKFLMFRRDLPRNRFRRICPILMNELNGNYDRHSSGLLSAAKDFFRKK